MTFKESIFSLIERVTGAHPVITTDHAAIHDGIAFSAVKKFASLAAGASAYLEFIVPAGAYVHFKPVSIQADGPKVTLQIIEAPTLTTGTTAITPVNRRRVGTPTASLVTIHSDPSGISAGTIVDQDYIGGGTGAGGSTVSGGMATNENEWPLKPATTYLCKVTNDGSAAVNVNVKVFWYEEVNA